MLSYGFCFLCENREENYPFIFSNASLYIPVGFTSHVRTFSLFLIGLLEFTKVLTDTEGGHS